MKIKLDSRISVGYLLEKVFHIDTPRPAMNENAI